MARTNTQVGRDTPKAFRLARNMGVLQPGPVAAATPAGGQGRVSKEASHLL